MSVAMVGLPDYLPPRPPQAAVANQLRAATDSRFSHCANCLQPSVAEQSAANLCDDPSGGRSFLAKPELCQIGRLASVAREWGILGDKAVAMRIKGMGYQSRLIWKVACRERVRSLRLGCDRSSVIHYRIERLA